MIERFFTKPWEICQYDETLEAITTPEDIAAFAVSRRKEIEEQLHTYGLRVRRANLQDYSVINEILRERFRNTAVIEQSPFYDVFRTIHHGHSYVLQDARGTIVGYDLSISYDDDARTSYLQSIAIDSAWSGRHLQVLLTSYASLVAMERGSRTRRALVHPGNFPSLQNLLNYTGFLGEDFYEYLPGFEGCRFVISFSLTPAGMMNNRVDSARLMAYIGAGKPEHDYRLLRCEDTEGLARMYHETPFRVVAFVKKGLVSHDNLLFAVHQDRLNYPEDHRSDYYIR